MKPELFFGLVGAIGTDLQKVSNVLAQILTEFGYNSIHIRLSALLDEIFPDLPKEPEEVRIESHMDAGDKLRTLTETGSSLAVMAISRVRAKRITDSGDAAKPLDAHAFIFNSLKHPKEIEVLRRI
jgi:cytidine deaminase